MTCRCDYAFFVDGVPVHCTGQHSGGGTRPLMHRLPAMPLTAATLIETYGKTGHCINCPPGRTDE